MRGGEMRVKAGMIEWGLTVQATEGPLRDSEIHAVEMGNI